MMKIRWSKQAERDFNSIDQFLSLASASAANSQCTLIVGTIDQIKLFPRSGVRARGAGQFMIAVPKTPYRIYYRMDGNILHILAIRHGARRPL